MYAILEIREEGVLADVMDENGKNRHHHRCVMTSCAMDWLAGKMGWRFKGYVDTEHEHAVSEIWAE